MVELQPVVACSCGMAEVVPEREGGQSLFGTACFKSLQHEGTCAGSSSVKSRFVKDD